MEQFCSDFPKGDLGVYVHAYQQAANSLVEEFREKPYYSDAEACPIATFPSRFGNSRSPSRGRLRSMYSLSRAIIKAWIGM